MTDAAHATNPTPDRPSAARLMRRDFLKTAAAGVAATRAAARIRLRIVVFLS